MAMNEALAVGVPLVITEDVRFAEILEWGAGLVVPAHPQPLAAAIARILKHSEEAEGMRQAGRRLASERLAWPDIARRMIEAYEEVLSPAERGGRPIILQRIEARNV